ncbi:hypothetical protein QBC39DRAFT_430247 [Podospora conica]|nr:hypothetical protein QBC39DRAFT_430247 [Schizothecium conicum]
MTTWTIHASSMPTLKSWTRQADGYTTTPDSTPPSDASMEDVAKKQTIGRRGNYDQELVGNVYDMLWRTASEPQLFHSSSSALSAHLQVSLAPDIDTILTQRPTTRRGKGERDKAVSRSPSRIEGSVRAVCDETREEAKDVIDDCACQCSTPLVFLALFEKEEAIISARPVTASHRQTPAPSPLCEYAVRGNEAGSLCGEAGLQSAPSHRHSQTRVPSVLLLSTKEGYPGSEAVNRFSDTLGGKFAMLFLFAITFQDGRSEGVEKGPLRLDRVSGHDGDDGALRHG